ncbi:SPFH domain-containing protein [Streptomyces sp. NPDC001414]
MNRLRTAALLTGVGAASLGALKLIQVIPDSSAALVERFGRYTRTTRPGINLLIPFVDSIRNRIDLREQVVRFPVYVVSARDGVSVPALVTVMYRISDPHAATYDVSSYIFALEQRMLFELSNSIATLSSDNAAVGLRELSDHMRDVLAKAAVPWGLEVTWVGVRGGQDRTDGESDHRGDAGGLPFPPHASTVMMVERIENMAAHGDSHFNAPFNHGIVAQGHNHRHHMTNNAAAASQPTAQEIALAIITLVRNSAADGTLEDGPQAVASAEELQAVVSAPAAEPQQRERFQRTADRLLAAVGTASVAATALTDLLGKIRELLSW